MTELKCKKCSKIVDIPLTSNNYILLCDKCGGLTEGYHDIIRKDVHMTTLFELDNKAKLDFIVEKTIENYHVLILPFAPPSQIFSFYDLNIIFLDNDCEVAREFYSRRGEFNEFIKENWNNSIWDSYMGELIDKSLIEDMTKSIVEYLGDLARREGVDDLFVSYMRGELGRRKNKVLGGM